MNLWKTLNPKMVLTSYQTLINFSLIERPWKTKLIIPWMFGFPFFVYLIYSPRPLYKCFVVYLGKFRAFLMKYSVTYDLVRATNDYNYNLWSHSEWRLQYAESKNWRNCVFFFRSAENLKDRTSLEHHIQLHFLCFINYSH